MPQSNHHTIIGNDNVNDNINHLRREHCKNSNSNDTVTNLTFCPDSQCLSYITNERTLEALLLPQTSASTSNSASNKTYDYDDDSQNYNHNWRSIRFFPDDIVSNDPSNDQNNKINEKIFEDDYESLSLAEKLRRERQRVSYSGNGIHSYQWNLNRNYIFNNKSNINSNKRSCALLVPQRECIYYTPDYTKYKLQCVYKCNPYYNNSNKSDFCLPMDVRLSPCGNFIGFVQLGDLFVLIKRSCHNYDCNKNMNVIEDELFKAKQNWFFPNPIRLTFSSRENSNNYNCSNKNKCVSYGTPDFLSMEEISRYEGYWFTSDGSGIVFTKVDESDVERYRIYYNVDEHNQRMEPRQVSSLDVEMNDEVVCDNVQFSSTCSSCYDDGESDEGAERYEEHRYPFAGRINPVTTLGYISLREIKNISSSENEDNDHKERQALATSIWEKDILWQEPPGDCSEYLVSVIPIPNAPKSVICSWQNRSQNKLALVKWNLYDNTNELLFVEQSPASLWVNLSNIDIHILADRPIDQVSHESEFDFIFTSERTGFTHMYLYRYIPASVPSSFLPIMKQSPVANLVQSLSTGTNWIVEAIQCVDYSRDIIYFSGTYDSPLERHVYALPLDRTGKRVFSQTQPVRITIGSGIHNVIFDPFCRYFVDSSSDLTYSNRIFLYELVDNCISDPYSFQVPESRCLFKLQKSMTEITPVSNYSSSSSISKNNIIRGSSNLFLKIGLRGVGSNRCQVQNQNMTNNNVNAPCGNVDTSSSSSAETNSFPSISQQQFSPPSLFSFPSSTDPDTLLHAALYCPDSNVHGPGPYPLVVAVYGGPHVQRIQRSYSLLCSDMRAQRLRQLGFAVIKCDNRGSSRRGHAFESVIRDRLGFIEVQDQVAAVHAVVEMGIADPDRVGIYGWSYGGYLSAMCLCRAPDIFKVAVAGAPVTSWDGYDTHYTERYMSTPQLNPRGYEESSVFYHVPNLRPDQRLMLVHGLIDENVHYRHTSRLINELKRHSKNYDLLLFPDARHSPRKIRDRVYMEQKICDYFIKNLKEVMLSDAFPVENLSNCNHNINDTQIVTPPTSISIATTISSSNNSNKDDSSDITNLENKSIGLQHQHQINYRNRVNGVRSSSVSAAIETSEHKGSRNHSVDAGYSLIRPMSGRL